MQNESLKTHELNVFVEIFLELALGIRWLDNNDYVQIHFSFVEKIMYKSPNIIKKIYKLLLCRPRWKVNGPIKQCILYERQFQGMDTDITII